MKKIAIILGTRPEIIKLSPVIRELQKRNADFFIIHTGQHYDPLLDSVFFQELKLPQAKYNLKIGSHPRAKQIRKMVEKISDVLKKEKPDVSIVQGDTNTVLAGALASDNFDIKIAHVEAGLRSYDNSMPEEINRIETDKISHWLFAPTAKSATILKKEKVGGKIMIVGNTIVDVVKENKKIAKKNIGYLIKKDYPEGYALLTLHRPSNVDDPKKLQKILSTLGELDISIIWPAHPRSEKSIKKNKIKIPLNISPKRPFPYLTFLAELENAKLVFTDSGGIQEEACVLKIPCITLRENTERPETLIVKSNVLVGSSPKKIIAGYNKMIKTKKNWKNPFGDGKASKRIVNEILK